MSITDELREYFGKSKGMFTDHVLAIADRIDAEHERLMEERADRYSELRTILKERYIELPKDTDEVPWSVGDRDESGNTVTELRLTSSGWCIITDGKWRYLPEHKRHYHTPTVEDVLRDVVTLCHNTWKEGSAFEFYDVDDVMKSGNIADFAAKLRLAGDDE